MSLTKRNLAFNTACEKSPQDIHIACVVRGVERYTILYRDDTKAEAIKVLGKWASDPGLSFTWFDCARLAKVIREAT